MVWQLTVDAWSSMEGRFVDQDFVEMLSALIGARAEFLIVGAHALAAHGKPRATGDLDIWVPR